VRRSENNGILHFEFAARFEASRPSVTRICLEKSFMIRNTSEGAISATRSWDGLHATC